MPEHAISQPSPAPSPSSSPASLPSPVVSPASSPAPSPSPAPSSSPAPVPSPPKAQSPPHLPSATHQGQALGESLHSVLEAALSSSSSTHTDSRLSLLYPDVSRLTTVHDGAVIVADGLLGVVSALEKLHVLGAKFSVDALSAEYWPGRIQVKTAGTLLCKVGDAEYRCRTYFRDVVFTYRRVQWVVSNERLTVLRD